MNPNSEKDLFALGTNESERINAKAWDRMASLQHPLATRAKDDELAKPLSIVDEIGWLGGNIRGWHVLCLAAGGGRHSALYAAAGARITVVDISPGMLEIDRQMALEKKFEVRLFQASMSSMPMLQDGEFDLVIHPVSTCYLNDIQSVFREVARVLKPGGLYISQHKQPVNLQASLEPRAGHYVIEYPPSSSKPVAATTVPSRLREPGTQEFAHSLESIIGGICRSGMVIEDLVEPRHGRADQPIGSFAHRCHFIPPYIRIKSRRPSQASKSKVLSIS
jgi:ubiquinone/menaquinone biosynthesis C-methylase UbiE